MSQVYFVVLEATRCEWCALVAEETGGVVTTCLAHEAPFGEQPPSHIRALEERQKLV